MRIGIIGAGRMSGVLARRWVGAGHEVLVAGRTPAKAEALARELGPAARHGTLPEAARFGDVVLLAVLYPGVVSTLQAAGAAEGAFAGRVIIDCNNPVEVERFSLVTDPGTSMAETIQQVAVGSRVVKAFNLCEKEVWATPSPVFDGRRLVVPHCGDDEAAKETVRALIRDLGCEPLDAGPLAQAHHLEAMAAVIIRLLWTGYDPRTVFNLITPEQRAAA